jgi:hypothetical protein
VPQSLRWAGCSVDTSVVGGFADAASRASVSIAPASRALHTSYAVAFVVKNCAFAQIIIHHATLISVRCSLALVGITCEVFARSREWLVLLVFCIGASQIAPTAYQIRHWLSYAAESDEGCFLVAAYHTDRDLCLEHAFLPDKWQLRS